MKSWSRILITVLVVALIFTAFVPGDLTVAGKGLLGISLGRNIEVAMSPGNNTTIEQTSWGYEYHLSNGDVVQVGDNTTTDFRAVVKTIRNDGICWFSLNQPGIYVPSLDGLTILFDFNANTKVKIYPVEPCTRLPEGGIEYDIQLLRKPAQNILTLNIDWQGITWQKILALDAEYDEARCENEFGIEEAPYTINATAIVGSNGTVFKTRELYEVNSYLGIAIDNRKDTSVLGYNDVTQKDITYSKVSRTYLHIHRGLMTDALNNTVWVEDISINESGRTITFTLPKDWIKNAIYPVNQVCGLDPAYTQDWENFLSTTLTGDSVWTDKDLTASCADSAVVEIIFANQEVGVENTFGARAAGSSLTRTVTIHEAEPSGETHCRMFVQLNATGVAEFYHSDISDDDIFYIVGYWENVSFTEAYDEFQPTNQNAGWETHTFANGASLVHQVALTTPDESSRDIGVRSYGGSLSRKIVVHEAEAGGNSFLDMLVKADASKRIEKYSYVTWSTGAPYLFIDLGYFGSEMDFVELWESNQGIDSWADWDLTAYLDTDGRMCDFLLVHSAAAATATMGVRAGSDTSTARTLVEHEAEPGGSEYTGFGMSAQSHTDGTVHIQLPATTSYCYFTGYFTPVVGGAPDISVNPTGYTFGQVTTSITYNTTTSYFTITNVSTMQTDQTISVTSTNWTGGLGWYHSETCTPGVATAGLKSNRGGTWGTGDVIVKNSSPGYIYENCPVTTNYTFGLSLHTPTVLTDGVLKEIIVRITAAAG